MSKKSRKRDERQRIDVEKRRKSCQSNVSNWIIRTHIETNQKSINKIVYCKNAESDFHARNSQKPVTFQYYGNRKCEPELLTADFFVENLALFDFSEFNLDLKSCDSALIQIIGIWWQYDCRMLRLTHATKLPYARQRGIRNTRIFITP